MKESVRTVLIILVIIIMVGFMVWVSNQSDENLESNTRAPRIAIVHAT